LPDTDKLRVTVDRLTAQQTDYERKIKVLTKDIGELQGMKQALNMYLGRNERNIDKSEGERN
jgi:hypothetical protein